MAKYTLPEFRKQLGIARSLPAGDARKSLIDDLRASQVVEVAADGKETPIAVEVIEADPSAVKAVQQTTTLDDAAVKRLVEQAMADAVAKSGASAAATKVLNPTQNPTGKFVLPSTAKRYGTLKNFARKEVGGLDADARAYRFGMWNLAIMGNAKAIVFCQEQNIPIIKAAHAEGTNTLGGYLVPEEFGTDLIDLREKYGVARRLLKVVPMSSDTRTDPRRVSGLTAYFVAESGAGTESNKGWDQVRLTAKDLMVLSRMSNQVNDDAVINIGDDLAGEIAYAFTLKEDQCAWLGTGSTTYGGIVGFNQKLTDINGVDEGGGIILASGNLFSEFTLADHNRVVARIPQYAAQQNPVWVAHRTYYYGTMQRLELASGGVTALEVRQGNTQPRPLFLGFPVEVSQVMPSADVNSQIATTFGDHALAASFGDRQQDSISFSEHATIGGESVFERNQLAIRGVCRMDINVHDCGTSTVAGPVVGLLSQSS